MFQFNTAFGAVYDVQFTANLTDDAWSVVASNLAGSGELVTITNADPTHRPCQFYRVRQLP